MKESDMTEIGAAAKVLDLFGKLNSENRKRLIFTAEGMNLAQDIDDKSKKELQAANQ